MTALVPTSAMADTGQKELGSYTHWSVSFIHAHVLLPTSSAASEQVGGIMARLPHVYLETMALSMRTRKRRSISLTSTPNWGGARRWNVDKVKESEYFISLISHKMAVNT
jgi:hypothetical protein